MCLRFGCLVIWWFDWFGGFDSYQKFHTASKTSKGGTAIYVNKYFDSFERIDLNINSLECESTWIEIKKIRSKNIVIASIYRHPHNNLSSFNILKTA